MHSSRLLFSSLQTQQGCWSQYLFDSYAGVRRRLVIYSSPLDGRLRYWRLRSRAESRHLFQEWSVSKWSLVHSDQLLQSSLVRKYEPIGSDLASIVTMCVVFGGETSARLVVLSGCGKKGGKFATGIFR